MRTFPGKDAGLISFRKLIPTPRRPRAPLYNLCALPARAVRIAFVRFAFCIIHFAFCNQLLAQTSASAPPITRLPSVDGSLKTAQLPLAPLAPPMTVPPPASTAPSSSFRSVQIHPRYDGLGPTFETLTTPQGEHIAVLTGGVNVIVQGLDVQGLPAEFGPLGDIDIETDRIVIWGLPNLGGLSGAMTQPSDLPLEIYMEGNIVFRQGDRTFFADRMFYDVKRQVGTIINAELLAGVPELGSGGYMGFVRLRAAALRQLDNAHFVAQNGLVTTSRIENPTYAFTADTITFEDLQQKVVDPVTGQPATAHRRRAQAQNNFVYLGDVPVFWWPTMSTTLENPNYYISGFRIRQDNVFGFQALVDLDAFQLTGIEAPDGVDWNFDLDYLSKRGFGYGSGVQYARDSFFSLDGPTTGRGDVWFISDHGHDNLGRDRRNIVPEKEFRGRAFWNHRQHLVGGLMDDWTVQGEVGWLSDRTFQEEYYENEWDENKDQLTGVRLKRTYDNQSISIEANGRINDFFTQTQWLPRLDHNWLGQSLIEDNITWFEHSSLAYANQGIASTPTNPTLASQFELFPWEENSAGGRISGKGERLVTRQELDFPLDLAPFKVVPFALGELGHWGQDINGDDVNRALINAGVRASIPFWYADPSIRHPLFNLNGLAHKVVFDAQVSWAEATEDMNRFPLYDEIDDDSIEDFRRRMFFSPFGGILPGLYYIPGAPSFIDPKFDPRFVALRAGMQDWVTAPSSEIAEDLLTARLGMHHRLQTKRGAPGQERIIDWVTFNANATIFPDADRDNFGQEVGMLDYDFQWFLGDRFSILSDGYADTFGDALKTASIGVLMNRPRTGNLYVGFRASGGLFESYVLNTTLNYRMSPKWIGSVGSSVDFGPTGNIGQYAAFSRIGESLITTIGANVDASKGSVGASFMIEPRFFPSLQATRKTGIEIPPVGASGLE